MMLLIAILFAPVAIAVGIQLFLHFRDALADTFESVGDSIFETLEKPKREPITYYADTTEPDYAPADYVVGIGDDGELVYASEKPKNDEVGE